jgi:ribosomal-protein-alanine acetyltransferase
MVLEGQAVAAAHWDRRQYAALFANAAPRRVTLVIEAEADVQGFLIARVVGPEWELENIAVASVAQRRGLGTRLLGEVLEQARAQGAQAVLLEVRESNRAARGLYEKCGFIQDGHRKSYYRDPQEDAVVYRLPLP